MIGGYDPDYQRDRTLDDRQYYNGLLVKQLAELAAEVDKAATALDRPGGRAIRNRMVKTMRFVIEVHRLARHYQGELDEMLGIGREPCEVIPLPTASVTELRVVSP
jgi:hypothetical protein